MKIRSGFVSNSSSSSFILDKRYLSGIEIKKILTASNNLLFEGWDIIEDEDFIKGFTSMDNGELHDFIKNEINPRMKAIVIWED